MKEVQLKWRNFRTCFKRELNKQTVLDRSGQSPSKRRRKYIYFDQLSFLLPHVENRALDYKHRPENENNVACIKVEEDDEYEAEMTDEDEEDSIEYPPEMSSEPNQKTSTEYHQEIMETKQMNFENRLEYQPNITETRQMPFENHTEYFPPESITTKITEHMNMPYEERILNLLKDIKQEEIDEDRSFLLSLVPCFKKLTDDQKIQAKMEFLKVIQRIRK